MYIFKLENMLYIYNEVLRIWNLIFSESEKNWDTTKYHHICSVWALTF